MAKISARRGCRLPMYAVAAMVCALALSSCGQQQAQSEVGAGAGDTQSRADSVREQIWGSGPEKEAAHYLGWRAMTDPIDSCMTGQGFSYLRRFEPIWNGYRPNGLGEGWIAPLQFKQSSWGLAEADVLHAALEEGDAPPEQATDAYKAAASKCEAFAGDPTKWDYPPGVSDLDEAYDTMLASVELPLGPIETYDNCMAEAGFEFDEDGFAGLSVTLQGRMPLPPRKDEAPSPEWTDYLSYESRVLDADQACRIDKYNEGIALLDTKLRDFQQQHTDDLDKVDAEWHTILNDAIAEGFDPDKPGVVEG